LYALLRKADIHVTELSSVVLEAKEFSVPSIIVHEMGKEYYKKEIDDGVAFYESDTYDIIDLINSLAKRKRRNNFKNFSTNDMDQLLNEVLNLS